MGSLRIKLVFYLQEATVFVKGTVKGTVNNPIILTKSGLYCPAGNFYIDPWGKAERAVITHGHADHARFGSNHYYCSQNSVPILQQRLPKAPVIEGLNFGDPLHLGDAKVSLHPAGHIRGSAQVRVEVDGQVWVITGDYKRCYDPTSEPFEVVPCDVLITEATFAVPIYRWQPGAQTAAEIYQWWMHNRAQGLTSLLFCYALGKAQRILAELTQFTEETIYIHGAVKPLTDIYRDQGVAMVATEVTSALDKTFDYRGQLVIAPPSAHRSTWMKRFKQVSTGFASGWMQIRGNRRRRGYERGFILSDHADWPSLLQTVRECGAKRVFVTHGQKQLLAQHLRELGYHAEPLDTLFGQAEDET